MNVAQLNSAQMNFAQMNFAQMNFALKISSDVHCSKIHYSRSNLVQISSKVECSQSDGSTPCLMSIPVRVTRLDEFSLGSVL
jgi:hypothetical protein